jgi:Flp pilus assembly protein TadB
MSIIPDKVAAKIDAKVDAGKVIPEWRRFFHFGSVRWSLSGFFVALGYSAGLAAMSVPWLHVLPNIAFGLLVAGVFLGSMYARLKAQTPPEPEHDDTDDADA